MPGRDDPPPAVYVCRLPVEPGGTTVGDGPAVNVGPGVREGPGPGVKVTEGVRDGPGV